MNTDTFTLTYGLSRPFPYKWFPYFVVLGGVVASILFSFINYAADGFYLAVEYTNDPNGTMSQGQWFNRWPLSLFEKVSPSCQPHDFPLNAQLYTNKLSLPYTLTSVWQEINGKNMTMSPSLTYSNNILENCNISFIQVDLESTQRTAEQLGSIMWGPKATALITCSIANGVEALGHTKFNLTTNYELVTPLIGTGETYSFLELNCTTRASLWWGQSLLSWYWLDLAVIMLSSQSANLPDSNESSRIQQGSIHFKPTSEENITRSDFFFIDYHFFGNDENNPGSEIIWFSPSDESQSDRVLHHIYPDIWTQADNFAKAFYSAILVDLGSNFSANILTDPKLLQPLTNFETMTDLEKPWLKAGPARQSFEQLQNSTGGLGITPSTIYAQYLCQVPKQKATGSLLVSILVADLVLLQALWQIVKWVTTSWVGHRDPHANYCEGCSTDYKGHDEHELGHLDKNTSFVALQERDRSTTQRGRFAKIMRVATFESPQSFAQEEQSLVSEEQDIVLDTQHLRLEEESI